MSPRKPVASIAVLFVSLSQSIFAREGTRSQGPVLPRTHAVTTDVTTPVEWIPGHGVVSPWTRYILRSLNDGRMCVNKSMGGRDVVRVPPSWWNQGSEGQ